MTVSVLGEVPIATVNPAALSLSLAVTAGIGPVLAALNAQLAGLLEAQIQLTLNPPNLAALLAQAQALVAAVEAALLSGIPSIDVQLAAVLTAILDLQLQIGQLQLHLDLAASLPLTSATVQAAVYSGPAANFGAEMGAYFGGGVQGGGPASDAVVLCVGASTAQSKAALSAVFGV